MVERDLKMVTESRIKNETVAHLFNAFCQYGILTRACEILGSIPSDLREPIIHTLGSHVTKEKPVLVYSVLQSAEYPNDKSLYSAAIVDLLWTFSLMYDDMFDGDEKRSGLQSAWVKYGSEETHRSIRAGLETVKKFVDYVFGAGSADSVEKFVNVGLKSLELHKKMGMDISIDNLLQNYKERALFHTGLPFALLDQDQYGNSPAFQALENVNLAGQVLNDLKDISPKYAWLREGFSDIRLGIMTLPVAILLGVISGEEKKFFLSIFGLGKLSELDRVRLIRMFSESGAVEDASREAEKLYDVSLTQFRSVLNPEFAQHAEDWIGYKLRQLDNLNCK